MINPNLTRNRKAFSLIEAVIASGILAMVAGASLTLGITVIRGSQTLADRTQALYLVTEALEVATNVRDTNYIDEDPSTGWNSGMGPGNYGVIFDGARWKLSAAGANQLIAGTPFTRNIVIANSGAGEVVTATVHWDSGRQKVMLSTYLADSRKQL